MTDTLGRLNAVLATGIKVAKVARLANLDPQTITNSARGKTPPNPRTLAKIETALGHIVGHRCEHLDCPNTADLRFTLPNPIQRQESACRDHAEPLLGSLIRGITVEDI